MFGISILLTDKSVLCNTSVIFLVQQFVNIGRALLIKSVVGLYEFLVCIRIVYELQCLYYRQVVVFNEIFRHTIHGIGNQKILLLLLAHVLFDSFKECYSMISSKIILAIKMFVFQFLCQFFNSEGTFFISIQEVCNSIIGNWTYHNVIIMCE